jgi:hypothetical protein
VPFKWGFSRINPRLPAKNRSVLSFWS